MWHAESLSASYFQGSYYPKAKNVTGAVSSSVLGTRYSLRASCERVERINKLIDGTESLQNCDMCHLCAAEISRKIDRSFREVDAIRKSYQQALTKEHSPEIKPGNVSTNAKASNVDNYLTSADNEQLLAAIYDLEHDISLLESEEQELQNEKKLREHSARQRHLAALRAREKLLDLEYEQDKINEQIPRVLQLLETSAGEITHLRQSFSAGKRGFVLIPLTPLYDIALDPSNQCGFINGRRLAYRALSARHLNWSEINSSWAVLCSLLRGVRNFHELTECLDFSSAHCRDLATHCGVASTEDSVENGRSVAGDDCISYSLRLRPLKDRVLLLLQAEKSTPFQSILNVPTVRSIIGSRNNSFNNNEVAGRVGSKLGVPRSGRHNDSATPFPTHTAGNTEQQTPQQRGTMNNTGLIRKNTNTDTTAPGEAQSSVRTVHLEGGIQESHTRLGTNSNTSSSCNANISPAPRGGSSLTHTYATGTTAMAEYCNAVLLVAAAAALTLLEVAKSKAPSCPRPAGVGVSSISRAESSVESMFVGYMVDVACVLLVCENVCPEVPYPINGTTTSSFSAAGAAGGAKTPTTTGCRSPVPPDSPSLAQSVINNLLLRSVVRHESKEKLAENARVGAKCEKLRSYATFCELGGSAQCRYDILSCLLVSAGVGESDTDAFMDQLVVDLLRTLVKAMEN